MVASDLAQVIEQYHQTLDAFVKGDPEPLKALYSRRGDVTITNPFGPPARGWDRAAATMERAASNFREGEAAGFERVSEYTTADLAYTVEVERFRAQVGGTTDMTPSALRVTTVFRREDNAWRVVHRHADPITAPRPPESIVPR